ncbi:MAG TPA: hypothetical protein VGF32_04915 [Streptosporangiaceae bacterium]
MSAPLTPAVRRALWRIPAILAEDGFATDATLSAELGLDRSELRTAIVILYKRRKIDRIGDYVVPPAAPRQAA